MKICIIGKDSYIGNHIDEWLTPHGHDIYQLDVLNNNWKAFNYSTFDVVIHVAGIVHKPDCTDSELYKRVNTDMPVEIAELYKNASANPKLFIFLSTMAVYGVAKRLQKNVINKDTPTNPTGLYGISKKSAEDELLKLQDNNFNVVIIRPPNVYGKNCKGGYIRGFLSVVKKIPIIPKVYTEIKQSMIYIDNLCELIRLLIEDKKPGIFMPQDEKPVSAIEIIQTMATALDKRIITSKTLGFAARLISFIPVFRKAYGGIEYSQELSDIPGLNYRVVSFEEAIKRTVY